MKILLAHSDPKLPSRESIDLWRTIRPFTELEKHVDWQVDHVPYLVDDSFIGKDNKIATEDLVKEVERLGQYDIIWSSYFPDPVLFDVLLFVHEKYGTKFVLDADDDFFHIPASNPIWNNAGISGVKALQYMVENTPYLVTSCDNLKAEFVKHRTGKTYILPNYVGNDFKHQKFDNGDKVVISFFGSITHKRDISETGFLEALQQIMNKYKNVYVHTVGCSIEQYLPKQRYIHNVGKPGRAYLEEIWPTVNCDIAVAPLEDTQFNKCKTNIKWLEAAMIPAAFLGSNIAPYKGTVSDGKNGLLTNNTSEDWYEKLEALVTKPELRKSLAAQAHKDIMTEWHIGKKWTVLKEIVESIYADN